MEELADAIEDAQYVNAIATQDDGPRPVLPWNKPDVAQLEAWETRTLAANPLAFTLEWCCAQPIGLFLFSQYVKDIAQDYPRMCFVEDCLRFQRMKSRTARAEKAVTMARQFLGFDDNAAKETLEDGTVSYSWPTPVRTEIEEYDLAAVPRNASSTNIKSTKTRKTATTDTAEDQQDEEQPLSVLFSENNDYPICAESCVGICGPVLAEIYTEIKEVAGSVPVQPEAPTHVAPSRDSFLHRTSYRDLNRTTMDKHERVALALEALGSAPMRRPSDSTKVSGSRETSSFRSRKDEDQAEMSPSPPRETPATTTKRPKISLRIDLFQKAERIVMESLKQEYWGSFVESTLWLKTRHFLWYQDRPVVPEDFFVMRVLGRGGFGLVTACKKGTSGKLYAMKVMNKRRIKMKKSEPLALNERKALAAVESKFVINLKYSFHSKDDVFLILDLMTGGDLGYHLHQRRCFSKKECLYYAARIMLGLQALHNEKYVYRDLKPENCLLAEDGRVKITDLGLATKITPNLHGAAGTRGYWAPEMLRRDSRGKRLTYGHTVDWFSFGCCLAEFISGSNPFRSDNALTFGLERGKQTKEKCIDCATLEMDPLFPPEKFEPDAADLCRALLDKNEKTRLGYNGCEEIMAHPWFKSVSWDSISSDRKKPPFIPAKDVNAASQSEIGNFAEDKTYQETLITSTDEQVYETWEWTNPRAFSAEVIEFLVYERVTGEPLIPIAQHATCCCSIS